MKKTYRKLIVAAFLGSLMSSCALKPDFSFSSKSEKKPWRVSINFRKKELLPQAHPLIPSISPQLIAVSAPCSDLELKPMPVTGNCLSEFLPEDPAVAVRDSMIVYAKQFLGTPYRTRGHSAKGFDCSGFTSHVMAKFGYNVPSSSSSQAKLGEQVDLENAQKGDLLFFGYKGHNNSYRVNHAAMVISEPGEDLKFIHSSRRGIVIDDINSSSWKSYYAKRVLFAKSVLDASEEE